MPAGRAPRGPSAVVPLPRFLIAGAAGRLGRALLGGADAAGFPISAAFDTTAGIPYPGAVPIQAMEGSALRRALESADVFLTATNPEAERENLPAVARASVPAVVATTGLVDPVPEWLNACADRIPIVIDANFSLGMAILRRAVRSIGPLPEGFDISIVESHRRGKPDHPSGTARALAQDLSGSQVRGWHAANGTRAPGEVEIASLRGGETPGVHLVQVEGPSELLRFEHVAYGRETFALGMLLAARWLYASKVRPGFYRLDDILGDSSR